jgi:ParB family chromosome partitioning protein
MSKEIRRLGRGLASLVSPTSQPTAVELTPNPPPGPPSQIQHNRYASLRPDQIRPNPMQPRRQFDEASLRGLADSMKSKGTLQPIVVRPSEAGYELIAGERRLRAAVAAGLESIPAIVRAVKDEDLLELALIENVQRADLNPIERARAYKSLQDRYELSHDEIGRRMGEDRPTVSNYIRLLELCEGVLEIVAAGELGVGHAKALLGISDRNIQLRCAEQAVREGWSVRQTEAAASATKAGGKADPAPFKDVRPSVRDMEEQLTRSLGRRVTIKEGRKRHTGRLVLEYYSLEDFDRLVGMLGVQQESA